VQLRQRGESARLIVERRVIIRERRFVERRFVERRFVERRFVERRFVERRPCYEPPRRPTCGLFGWPRGCAGRR
jgi:hypothetical protein